MLSTDEGRQLPHILRTGLIFFFVETSFYCLLGTSWCLRLSAAELYPKH